MIYNPTRVKLVARWETNDHNVFNEPVSIMWADGKPATIDDLARHQLDTHLYVSKRHGLELHMYPNVVADVVYDEAIGAWKRTGLGIPIGILDVRDRNASDEQIYVDLTTFPVFYRPRIIRD
jgi:hypothetical protein